MELRETIRQAALDLGFARVGFAPLSSLPHRTFFSHWLAQGMAGSMHYLQRHSDDRGQPASLMPAAKVALVAVATYAAPFPDSLRFRGSGLIARFAGGKDYHLVVKKRLRILVQHIQDLLGRDLESLIAVDTAPLLERELGMAAGVGFIGKNTMLLSPGIGSYTVIGTLLLDLDLAPDTPSTPRCGRCRICLDACPTGALIAPYTLDARRCISYLTIEHRDNVDPSLREKISPWVFGCDLCQESCPYNATSETWRDPELAPSMLHVDLLHLLRLRAGDYRRLVAGRTLRRTPRAMWRRNAALAAGPLRELWTPELMRSLEEAARTPDHVLAEAASWALRLDFRV
jgi:epoxyqueuosine reductase